MSEMIFDYLLPAIGPVIEGLEDHEKIIGIEQSQYLPVRILPGEEGASAIYRCELTAEQRAIVAAGGDVLIEILHFGRDLPPTRVMVLNQSCAQNDEDRARLREWWAEQTKGPYRNK